jgi:hypothetical protein
MDMLIAILCVSSSSDNRTRGELHKSAMRGEDLTGVYCNILGCEARNRENTEVCIAFMHRKSGKFSRF